ALDLGCGTGISTRQLKEHGFHAIGLDRDEGMLEAAHKNDPEGTYISAVAEKLPFGDAEFDVVTAFTSFHWFDNENAISEIKRVLKNDGLFFTVLKRSHKRIGSEELTEDYKTIVRKYVGSNFDSTKNHRPKESLSEHGFWDIKERSFFIDESYTVEEALILVQSMSFWNLVAKESKPALLKELGDFYQQNLENGFFVRHWEISTVAGFKKA
ncbi:MAG: class I SAM-dependent methyltransferase, partial [Candidatus Pacebacteria bacterium]|nr:class I SAM-dependent methyltransferase [Candidatus Paceibacterota bacterium]